MTRNLLTEIKTIPETTAFFKAFTAKTPDGHPRGHLLMSNAVRMTKERLKPLMVALNAAFRAMYEIEGTHVWQCDWIPLPVTSKKETHQQKYINGKQMSRHKKSKSTRENANVEVIHDTTPEPRHAIFQQISVFD